MRAKNTKKYAYYYILLEDVIYNYNNYQNNLKEKFLNQKDERINEILKINKEQNIKLDEQSIQIEKLLSRTDHIINQNDELLFQNDNLTDKVEDLNEKVEEVREAFKENIDDINPKPTNQDEVHKFVVLQYKNEKNILKVIRAQEKSINKMINLYTDTDILIDTSYNPNPIDMFNLVKAKVKDMIDNLKNNISTDDTQTFKEKRELLKELRANPPIKIHYNTITLNFEKISLQEVIALINSADNKRYETSIP